MSEYRELLVRGRVILRVEAVVPEDKLQGEEHAANILKGGYFGTRTIGIDVEVDSVDGGSDEPWAESVEMLIGAVEEGDRVEIEYLNTRRNTSRKIGIIREVYDLRYFPHIIVAVRGAKHPWKVGSSISVSYDHERDGRQSKHLGRVTRIRSLNSEDTVDVED